MDKRKNKRKKHRHKATIDWENKFLPLLKEFHGTHSQGVFHRLMKKSSTLRSTLKRRSKEYEVEFNISLATIRELFLSNYGSPCKYCSSVLDVRNMVCDHVVPLSCGGPSTLDNLEMICRRCNTRKGPLTSKEYTSVVEWLSNQSEQVSSYIFRKLSGKEMF
jgi:5-methylcytosine-specific restriction endonuclease McrA